MTIKKRPLGFTPNPAGEKNSLQTKVMVTLIMWQRSAKWGLAAVILVIAAYWMPFGRDVPPFAEVRGAYRPSDGILLDRKGELLHELRVSFRGRRLAWTPLGAISPQALAMVLASEDRRFYGHGGVDFRALAGAFLGWLKGGKRRGASTITMQLVGLLVDDLGYRRGGRSLLGKWRQIQTARQLEKKWTKDEILEAYLNLVTFRGELAGIGAAARGLFGKGADGLTKTEGVILAAGLRNPNIGADRIIAEACRLAQRVAPELECRAFGIRMAESFVGDGKGVRPPRADAPQLARRLLRQGDAISTTMDAGLQRYTRSVLDAQMAQLESQNVHNGAVLVLNNDGEVLAYVGNTPRHDADSQVDGVRASRQAGSTLKPFIYGLVLEKGLLTAASLIEDAPIDIVTPTGLYVPRNYENDFKGWVSTRTALASSLNVPAVKVALLVGLDSMVSRLRQLGFSGISESGEYYGPSLALGSVDVSLWQLVNAYRTLANGGMASEMRLLMNEEKTKEWRVMDERAAFIVEDILSDSGARALTFGLDNVLNLPFESAVKTGTSKGMRDNWCIGFSREWTVGVWVGNFSGESMHDVSGISGAAPVWQAVMDYLGGSNKKQEVPSGVVGNRTVFSGNEEGTRWEWYLAGTEMGLVERAANGVGKSRIVYPGQGVVIALDPDIPRERERVFFRMEPERLGSRWRLNGVLMDREKGWPPVAGRHRLELLNEWGEVMDGVRFDVRGHWVPTVLNRSRSSGIPWQDGNR